MARNQRHEPYDKYPLQLSPPFSTISTENTSYPLSMNTIVSVNQARDHLGELIQQAHYLGKPFVLTRGKKPMAALIGTQEFGRILELVETYDPALADTLAMLTNPEADELLQAGDVAIQKGEMVPFDVTLVTK